jgi:hypothetical protein
MTPVALYDALAQAGGAADEPIAGRLRWVAERLLAGALADLQRVRELEEQCLTQDWRDAELHRRLTRSIYDLYREWATEAEQLLGRVQRPAGAAALIPRVDELDDAFWRVRARLQLTPEQIEHATEQARRGQTIPAEELRNELRARVRA